MWSINTNDKSEQKLLFRNKFLDRQDDYYRAPAFQAAP